MKVYNKLLRIFIFFFLLLPCITEAQKNITGKVLDSISRQPLEYVSVAGLNSPSVKTITDQYGNFSLSIPSNETAIQASYVGYKAASFIIENSTTIKIELQHDIVSLKDVVVLQSNNATKFNTLSKIDLDLKPVRNTQELLRLVPGLFIAQHAGGGKAEQIFFTWLRLRSWYGCTSECRWHARKYGKPCTWARLCRCTLYYP